VAPRDAFEVLVVGDLDEFPFRETADALLTALFQKYDRQEPVHLVLLNPDLIYPTADMQFGVASGSLALVLEAALQLRYPDRRMRDSCDPASPTPPRSPRPCGGAAPGTW
jgi:ribonucleotide monophosphatase NagD (HAD superfamily)